MHDYDYLILGSGIIGMTLARELIHQQPDAKIGIIDKEVKEAQHASSRNSGVLHAGFYYTADSLKARMTAEGNRAWKEFCAEKKLAVNTCGKLVVAQNQEELDQLYELERRGKANGSNVSIISEAQATDIEPNIKTFQKALYSPDTASVNPGDVCAAVQQELVLKGIIFHFKTAYISRKDQIVKTTQGEMTAKKVINCAGLYADQIAHDYGFGKDYTILPFKGLYLKYTKNTTDIRTNIYPVPNLKNPFLGVHYTKTVDGGIKIGPTAIPAFWRENYDLLSGFQIDELFSICFLETTLFCSNAFGFRNLAMEECRKYNKKYFVGLAEQMVKNIDPTGFTTYTNPGIRAQLLHKPTKKLVQDFVIEGDEHSIHVLNAVSPAFTCAIPFARYIVQNFILKN